MKLIIIQNIPELCLQEGDRGEFEPLLAKRLVSTHRAIYDGYEPQVATQPAKESSDQTVIPEKEKQVKEKSKK